MADQAHNIVVPKAAFESGDLPAICCMTGEPAVSLEVAQPANTFSRTRGFVPVSAAHAEELTHWTRWWRQTQALQAVLIFVAFFGPAIAEGLSPGASDADWVQMVRGASFFGLALVISAGLWAFLGLRRRLPRVAASRDQVVLKGVHPAFADAVERKDPARVVAAE